MSAEDEKPKPVSTIKPIKICCCATSTVFVIGILLVIGVLGYNTLTLVRPPDCALNETLLDISDEQELLNKAFNRLAVSLQFKTLPEPEFADEFVKFHAFLRESFPDLFRRASVSVISNHSLLMKINGINLTLKPYMISGYSDVSFIEEKTSNDKNLFLGVVRDKAVWGRGALDGKSNVMAVLETAQFLLEQNFTFHRTLYIAISHDKNSFWPTAPGAIGRTIADEIGREKDSLEFILDAGSIVIEDFLPNLNRPVALISVGEKGYADFQINVTSECGLSSVPPLNTAIGKLAKAIKRLNPNAHPAIINPVLKVMFEQIAPYASFPENMIFSNMWFFSPLVKFFMKQEKHMNAAIRTSTVVTAIGSESNTNTFPTSSWAVVNHRILPGETIEDVFRYDQELLSDVGGLILKKKNHYDPPPVSPFLDNAAFGYDLLTQIVKSIFPRVIVVPSILNGHTDSKHYTGLTRHIYRFTPLALKSAELSKIPGKKEHIEFTQYKNMINFYLRLVYKANDLKVTKYC